jgi:hypothetical protein
MFLLAVRDVPKGIPDDIGCGFIIRQPTTCAMETNRGGLQILGICVRDRISRRAK